MPDFAKALRALTKPGEIGDLTPGVRPLVSRGVVNACSFSLAEQLQFLRSCPGSVLPAGDVHSNALGSHYYIDVVYPEDHFHGKVRLSRLSSRDLEYLMKLMREKGSVPHRDRIVFLDTETTGVQGGTGICPFLVGIGCFEGEDFHVAQYFIRDFDEEPSMLLALAKRLRDFELVVTYNGTAFDIPLMETRFALARLDSPFESMSHFDLLFTTRKLWRNEHGSCQLVTLEREMLSFLQGSDIPGAMIPRAYFDYLQRRA